MDKVYCRLKPSKIEGAGVGVFAICTIKLGTDPFEGCETDLRIMDKAEYDQLSLELQKMIMDFCYYSSGNWRVPKNFNKIDISWYVNSSTDPNLEFDYQTGRYIALRNILSGEELTYEYAIYSV